MNEKPDLTSGFYFVFLQVFQSFVNIILLY